MSKNYEYLTTSSEAKVMLKMFRLMLILLAQPMQQKETRTGKRPPDFSCIL